MAFEFDRRGEPVSRAARRIAGHLLRQAATQLSAQPTPGIHEARKSIKKTRAILRLVRDSFDDFDETNTALRDIGRSIASSREAEVLPLTVAALGAGASETVRQAMARLVADATADPAASPASFSDAAGRLAALSAGASGWSIRAKGFGAIEGGLAEAWSQAIRTGRRSSRSDEPEALHEWRKRVKDHWYHARLLTPIWPAAMQTHATAVGIVTEHLGDCQDIEVLLDHLSRSDIPPDTADAVRAHARGRIATHEEAARNLADRIFCEDAEALVARWRRWWRLWQSNR